jgi:carboxymethylenebutenolidase
MVVANIRTQGVSVSSGTLGIPAYLAMPEDAGSYPAVIVIQEIFGVNSHIRDVTERFAREGFVAIAPTIYHRLAPGFEIGYTQEDVILGRKYKEQTRVDQLLRDMQGAIAYLNTLPQVKPEGVGCIGFCFGGLVAYLTATLPDVKATASFYGAGMPVWCPGSDQPTLAYTADIKGTIHLFFGMDDPSIPPDHREAIASALKAHQIDHHLFCYPGAQHGFFCDQRASYHADAAADAWKQVLELFHTHL